MKNLALKPKQPADPQPQLKTDIKKRPLNTQKLNFF
jgi:hypothetical protein